MINKLYGYGGLKVVYGGTSITFTYDKAYGQVTPVEEYILDKDMNGNLVKTTLGWGLEISAYFEHIDSTDETNLMSLFNVLNLAGAAGQPITIYPRFNSAAINPLGVNVYRTGDFEFEEPDRLQFYEKVSMEFKTATRLAENPIRVDIPDVHRLVTAAGNKVLNTNGNYIAVIVRS